MPWQARRAMRLARRAWPFALAAYRRWERMPEHEKQRYKRRVREYGKRGRKAYDSALKRARKRR